MASPGRDLSNRGGIFRFGALRGTGKFRYIFRHFFAKIPIPIQAFASCRAGSHAFLWTGQVPELRIYVVGAVRGPSFGPKSQFSSFSGVPGKAHHPTLSLKSARLFPLCDLTSRRDQRRDQGRVKARTGAGALCTGRPIDGVRGVGQGGWAEKALYLWWVRAGVLFSPTFPGWVGFCTLWVGSMATSRSIHKENQPFRKFSSEKS